MKNDELKKLSDLIAVLRGEDGCPWDRAQRPKDILSDLVEEAYELQWAYAQGADDEVLEELGDVVFVLVFAIQLIQEEHPEFTLDRITSYTYEKIRRRHPHVFGEAVARTTDEGLAHWNRVKEEENRVKNRGGAGNLFADVPGNLPAVRRAEKIQRRAAGVGFDWPDVSGILEKIREETGELEAVLRDAPKTRCEEEIGDLFFSLLNLSRFLNIDGEGALVRANAKFIERFAKMEKLVRKDGRRLAEMSLEEMDRYWDRVKGRP